MGFTGYNPYISIHSLVKRETQAAQQITAAIPPNFNPLPRKEGDKNVMHINPIRK